MSEIESKVKEIIVEKLGVDENKNKEVESDEILIVAAEEENK